MKKGNLTIIDPHIAKSAAKIPWFTFLFLAAVFFVAQHDWYYSLKGGEAFDSNLDEITRATAQGDLLRRLAFFSLGVHAVVSLIRNRQYHVKINGSLGWLILFFLVWIFLSLAWSDDTAITLRRLVLLAVFSLGAIAVSQGFSLRELALWVLVSTAGYVIIGFGAELLLNTFHPLVGGYRFAGTIHPNQQGLNCALLFFASLFLMKGEKRWRMILVVTALVSLVFLFLTRSRSSLFFAVTALLFYWTLTLPLSHRFALLLCAIMAACIFLLLGDYILPLFQHAVALGRVNSDPTTLGGRIPLWGQILSYISVRPIQGYGYDCFWTSRHLADVASEQSWTAPHAHNAYLDVVLGLGLVGGTTYVLIAVIGIRRAFVYKLCDNINFGFIGVTLIFAALDGLVEPTVILPGRSPFVSFVCMVALAGLGFSRRSGTGRKICIQSGASQSRQRISSVRRRRAVPLNIGGAPRSQSNKPRPRGRSEYLD